MTTSPGPAQRASGRKARDQARASRTAAAQKPNVNKTRVGGGFNPSINPAVSITISKDSEKPGPGAGAPAADRTPGSDFMSNEDIRAFCEHLRRQARNRAVERAMDSEQLEAVLRHIPDSNGTMAGAHMRARRVSRHLKKIAKAEQAIASAAAQLYAQFEREYEAELRKVGPGRPTQTRQFGWT